MPGNVPLYVVTETWPAGILYRSFAESREFTVQENVYLNGEAQTRPEVSVSRGTWQIVCACTPEQVAELWAFYDNVRRSVPFLWTPEGDTVQRKVRFASAWNCRVGMARAEVQLQVVEAI